MRAQVVGTVVGAEPACDACLGVNLIANERTWICRAIGCKRFAAPAAPAAKPATLDDLLVELRAIRSLLETDKAPE
jgi:hypothetical protein